MTEIDLGYNPLQPRDPDGKWAKGRALTAALKAAPPGSVFETTAGPGVLGKAMGDAGGKRSVSFKSNLEGTWQGTDNWGSPLSAEALSKAYGERHGIVRSPEDQRLRANRLHAARDLALLRSKGGSKKAKAKSAKSLVQWLSNLDGKAGQTPHGQTFDNSNPGRSSDIDLDWTEWNKRRGGAGQVRKAPGVRNARARTEIKAFKASAGLSTKNAALGKKALTVLKRRASKSGHLRAKAILAAARGNVGRANKIEAVRQARSRSAAMSKPLRIGTVRPRQPRQVKRVYPQRPRTLPKSI